MISDGFIWINQRGILVYWCEREKKWLRSDECYHSMSGKILPRSDMGTLPTWAKRNPAYETAEIEFGVT